MPSIDHVIPRTVKEVPADSRGYHNRAANPTFVLYSDGMVANYIPERGWGPVEPGHSAREIYGAMELNYGPREEGTLSLTIVNLTKTGSDPGNLRLFEGPERDVLTFLDDAVTQFQS